MERRNSLVPSAVLILAVVVPIAIVTCIRDVKHRRLDRQVDRCLAGILDTGKKNRSFFDSLIATEEGDLWHSSGTHFYVSEGNIEVLSQPHRTIKEFDKVFGKHSVDSEGYCTWDVYLPDPKKPFADRKHHYMEFFEREKIGDVDMALRLLWSDVDSETYVIKAKFDSQERVCRLVYGLKGIFPGSRTEVGTSKYDYADTTGPSP